MRRVKAGELSVLLTGASGGIGRAVALALAGQGASMLVTGRDGERLGALCADIQAAGGRARAVAADLTEPDGRRRVVAEAAARGGVNVLINNAGVGGFGEFASQRDEQIERLVATNLLATMLLTRSLLPLLARQSRATVVNVGSIVGSLAMPGQVAYCASKFALRGFTEGLRRELAGSAVRVVYVAPRATDTPMNDRELRRFNERFGIAMDPPVVAAARIARAAVRGRAEEFLGWPEKLFVRVNALLPGLVDRALRRHSRFLAEQPDAGGNRLVHPEGAEQ